MITPPEGEFWKFRYGPSGFRKVFEPSQNGFNVLSEFGCRRRFITSDICDSRQKLGPDSRCEADFHDGYCERIESASARTVSKS